MKILHIATLITPNGAFGGPVRVAVNQVRALREAGHDALLVAGHSGFGIEVPTEYDGVPVKLFPVHQVVPKAGFPGLASPQLEKWLRAAMDSFDVVHFHLARDLVTLRAADLVRKNGTRYVVQTHGMIMPSSNPLAVPLDFALTKRVLRGASTRFFLTPAERVGLESLLGPDIELDHLPNGVPVAAAGLPSGAEGLDVLYLARLHPRKRPEAFAEAAIKLHSQFPAARFSIVGPDEGSRIAITRLLTGTQHNVHLEGSLPPESTLQRMARADVYVLPSIDEPFPMSVLEAMSLGKPVIITGSCGLAPAIQEARAGIVIEPEVGSLAKAIGSLLRDQSVRSGYGHRAVALVHAAFSMSFVLGRLEQSYAAAVAGAPRNRQLWIVQPYVPKYRVPFFDEMRVQLANEGIDVHVVAAAPDATQAKRGDAANPSWLTTVRPREVRIGRRRLALTYTRRYWKNADAVIVPHMGSSLDAWAAMLGPGRGRRRVGVWGHIASYIAPSHPLDQALETWQLRHADHVFAYTQSGAELAAKRGVRSDRVTSVGNSVDTANLAADLDNIGPADVAEFLIRHRIPSGPLLAYIGGLDTSKRVDFLMDALDRLHSSGSRIHVVVGGSGTQADLLSPAVARGQVTMMGYLAGAEKAVLLKACTAIVNPGRVGLLAVDALCAGRPVLTTHWSFHAPEFEYLTEGASVFCSDDDVASFAQLMEWAATHESLEYVANYPSLESMIRNFTGGVLSLVYGGAKDRSRRRYMESR